MCVAHSQELQATKAEVECLAQTMYFEAKGEQLEGQLAVGLVVLNRFKDPKFPKTICGIVRQKVNSCQFSWYCDGKSDLLPDTEQVAWLKKAAKMLITSNPEDVLTDGATFYHATYVNPAWSNLEKTVVIGHHVFYRRNTIRRS